MEKTVLTLMCHDYPLWTLDEETGMRKKGLPGDMEVPLELEERLSALQKEYDSFFSFDGEAYGFDGFENEDQRRKLLLESVNIAEELKALLGPVAEIENMCLKVLMAAPLKKNVARGIKDAGEDD